MLHILKDPQAYLCLEYSLVCSRLDTLMVRIAVTLKRGDKTVRAKDYQWRAFENGEPIETKYPDVEVRKTNKNVIMENPWA